MDELKIHLMAMIGSLNRRDDDWYTNRNVFRWVGSSSIPTSECIQRRLITYFHAPYSLIQIRKALLELIEEGFVTWHSEELYSRNHRVYYPTPLLKMLEQQ